MKALKILGFLISTSILATACAPTQNNYLTEEDPGTATIRIFKNNNSTSENRYLAPKNVKVSLTHSDLNTMNGSTFTYTCPSTGDVNILVIPVRLPGNGSLIDDSNSKQIRNDIHKAFFGENHETNEYPSLRSFYKESSFNKLNFSGTVTDWFDVKENTSIKSLNDLDISTGGSISEELLPKAIEWVKTQNIDLSNFDSNEDGVIDSIYFVYDRLPSSKENDFVNQGYPNYTKAANFSLESYTNQVLNIDSSTISPCAFSWTSFLSIYEDFAERKSNGIIDYSKVFDGRISSREFIYNVGLQLGLDSLSSSNDSNVHPAGKTTMMDMKLCDFDSYSKLTLGWITPYVVYGTSKILLPKANYADNCVIVIPSNYDEISNKVEYAIKNNKTDDFIYEFNPFNEYLLIDVYSPDGLNYFDTFEDVLSGNQAACSGTGVRIYHVDSRIFKAKMIVSDLGLTLNYTEGYLWDGNELENNEILITPITNSKTEMDMYQLPYEFNFFDRLRLIEAKKDNTFDTNGWMTYDSLFKPQDDPFEIENFGYRFFNARYSFNDGSDLPFKIKVETLKEVLM